MSQRHYVQLAGGSTLEVTDRVDLEGWELQEKAEEGAVGSGTIWLADPAMDLDVDGLRNYYVIEDESEATDNVIFGGFAVDPQISRGEQGGSHYDPVARMWRLQVTDRNGYWNRRVMTGTDCKRPAESDVARMQWLFASSEAAWIEDDTTYVSTASPSNMDKVDYRGQYLDQVVRDGAEHTGKNWWVQLQETGAGRKDFAWYAKDSAAAYTSPLHLTNDPAEMAEELLLDGTSAVWPIADHTTLSRDLSRLYSGGYLKYGATGEKAIYRVNTTTSGIYGRRDGVFDAPNVRTKAKAVARLNRYLADLGEPDERITTTVTLPKGKATMLRAGMRVPFKATHLPGYTTWQYLRVLSCTVKPVAAGDRYELALELQGSGAVAGGGPPYTGSAFAGILNCNGTSTGDGWFFWTGDSPGSGSWYVERTVGAMWTFITDGSGHYVGMVSSVAMRVRVQVAATLATVSNSSNPAAASITVLGQTDSWVDSGGVGLHNAGHDFALDFEYDLAAGEQVLFETTQTNCNIAAWYNGAGSTNGTFLRVGRGTHVWNTGSETWVGP